MSVLTSSSSGDRDVSPQRNGSSFRRKMSLRWLRQASIGERLHRLRLPRQNTIDASLSQAESVQVSPSHKGKSSNISRSRSSAERFSYFQKKILQSSNSKHCEDDKSGLVISDYISKERGELSVRVGQVVEFLQNPDTLSNSEKRVLVRLHSKSQCDRSDMKIYREGYVPISCLKISSEKTYHHSRATQATLSLPIYKEENMENQLFTWKT